MYAVSFTQSIGGIGLSSLSVSDTRPRMGRPALGVKPTQVRLSADVMARIDALAGPNKRAQFIREAVEAELARREKAKG